MEERSKRLAAEAKSLEEMGQIIEIAGDTFQSIGRLHYLVESKSGNGCYCIDLERVDHFALDGGCTCISFETRGTCRHWVKIRKYLDLD